MTFNRLKTKEHGPGGPALLAGRTLPNGLGGHDRQPENYVIDDALLDAVNVALTVGAPLLLTGKPGTGKTSLAHYCAWFFKVPLHPFHVSSTSKASDITYTFDAVRYFREASVKGGTPAPKSPKEHPKKRYVDKGPLYKAFASDKPSVVLIDEIDKAQRDFPNDLLHVIDQHNFRVVETDETIACAGARPLIIMTSNSERRLPEPFLRRCIYHHINLDEALVKQIVETHGLAPTLAEVGRRKFHELERRGLTKSPSPAELLQWLAALEAKGIQDPSKLEVPLGKLPLLCALVKDKDDRDKL